MGQARKVQLRSVSQAPGSDRRHGHSKLQNSPRHLVCRRRSPPHGTIALRAAERCVAAHHDADVGYFGIGQHVPCFGGLRNEVLPVMDHVSEDGPKETAARDELIIHPILRQGAQFASLMTTTFPFRKTPGEDPVKLHASGAGGLSYCEKVIRTRTLRTRTLSITCLQVQVWSTGVTLQGWVDDLRVAGCVLASCNFKCRISTQ